MTRTNKTLRLVLVKSEPSDEQATTIEVEASDLERFVSAELPFMATSQDVVLLFGDGPPRPVFPESAVVAAAAHTREADDDDDEVQEDEALDRAPTPPRPVGRRPAQAQQRLLHRTRRHLEVANHLRDRERLDELDDRLLERAMLVSDHLIGQVLKLPSRAVRRRCIEEDLHAEQLVQRGQALVRLAEGGGPVPDANPGPLQMLMNAMCSAGLNLMLKPAGKGEPQ